MTHHSRLFLGWLTLAATAFGLCTCTAAAQDISKFVISGEAAKKALTKEEISVETAEKIAKVCVDYAKQHNYTVAIYILAPNGNVVYSYRMDGQGATNIDLALKRAQTVLFWHNTGFHSTRELYNQGEGNGDLAREIRLYSIGGYPVPGGLSIIVDDIIIGAIGVGGSADGNDECANAGLKAVLGPQPPLAPKLPPAKQFAPQSGQTQPQPQR